jgi:hypothetical protein
MRLTPTREHYQAVVALRKQGASIREIAEKTGVAKSAVQRWLSIFAGENVPVMKKSQAKQKNRICGVRAPEHKVTSPEIVDGGNETLQERLQRLEKELKEARIRADLYEEIINVAEKKFDIQIIKKAGTKQ